MAVPKRDRLDPSILDRLLDPESLGTLERPGYSLRQMMDAVKADLHHLLNTRQTISEEAARFERVRRVLGFGMPDLITLNAVTQEEKEHLKDLVKTAIRIYEPRLQDVRVTIDEEAEKKDPMRLRIHVSARLAVDPAPDVALDTTLHLSTGHFIPAEGQP